MQSPSRLAGWGLVTGLVLALSSCGGGGGGGGGGGSGQGGNSTPTPTRTPTPLHTVPSRNERTEASAAGAITLRLSDIVIGGGGSSQFSVFLTDARGLPALCQGAEPTQQKPCTIQVETDPGLSIQPGGGLTLLSPNLALGTAGSDGSVSGAVSALLGGTFTVTARATDAPFDGLAASLSIVVNAPRVTATSTGAVGPTETPTPLPCSDVQTIIVQTDTFSVSSQTGGTAKITAAVFNSDNRGVAGVNVLFDVQPRIAFFDHLTGLTDATGMASATLTVPANTGFVGVLTVSSSACGIQGTVTVNVVSGVSTKPVATVVLQADPATVGDLTGGDVNLTAAVFDGDNKPIDGIDVLFSTPIGKVNPLVDRSNVLGAQHGIARSVLEVPVNAKDGDYRITALAGGVSGSVQISVVIGRGGGSTGPAGVPPGEPASITLGASPIRIQVAGTGGTELSTVIGRVFDNNGNPLPNVPVRYHVVAAQSAPGAVILPVTTAVPTASPSPVPTTACPPDDPVSVSDTAGFAVIQVHSGSQPGPVTVAACADTIISGLPSPLTEQQALVTVTSGPVSRISISINPRFVNNEDGTLLTTLTADVTDAQGNFVEDGTPVFFEIVRPQVCSGGSADGEPCSSSATCGGGTCMVDENDPSGSVTLAGNASTNAEPPCDTSQFASQTGLPVVPQPGSAVTCIKYPFNQQASEVQVRVTVASVVNNVGGQAVTLPGVLGDLEASVHPPTVQVSNLADSLAVVRATAFDPEFDGEENVRVRFTTDVGSIDRSVLTDVNGEADAVLTIPAGTASGTAKVRVTAGGVLGPSIAGPIVNTGGGTPTPGSSTQPAAIAFIGAEPAQIGVRGSGLPEQSALTFKVTDGAGNPVTGVQISFSLAKIADESIAPFQAITDENGEAQVTLTSGERALSVQVTAQVTTPTVMLITRSTAVNIVGGPPSQPNFSLAHQFHNVSGRVTLGLKDQITAFAADRFGNPVPPGTAVNFTTKSGAIGNATTTDDLGQAGATLVSQAPFTDTGNVTTLATTVGERPFVDMNGNGVCDDGIDQLLPVPEPFYDANCNRVYDAGEDFIDVNGNGHFDPDQLPDPSGNPTCHDRIVVFDSICTTFSGPTSAFLIPSATGPVEAGGGRDYTVIVSDNPDPIGNPGVGNPIVGGSTISVTISGTRARLLGLSNFTLPDSQTNDLIVDGLNRFGFSVVDNAPTSSLPEVDAVIVTITSAGLPAGGNGSVTVESFIEFLAAPTPTPTQTPVPPTGTPLPTSTSTPLPPAIAPIQAMLSAGSGAPPSACNGASQTFVVTGGSPPFTVSAGGGCVSVTSVAASGGSFLYTAGNLLGDYTITVTDALGRSAAAGVTVQGPPTPTATPSLPPTNTPPPTPTSAPTPPAAFIKLDLVVDQRSDNGDGSFTSVIGALVTDASGVVVGDNVEVDFTLVNPVAGVSVTSPGFTNQAQPCSIAFAVVPQPGDALSCIKYVQSLQGTAVRIRARVTIPSAPGFIEDVRDIVLPDNRPTVTPTVTQTPSVTPTPPATATSTGTVTPPPPPTPTVTSPPGSIQFVSAVPTAIGVRGSGQPEQSVLTFLVSSTLGTPIPGVGVDFNLIGTGSETLNPTHGTTDQNGMVTTTVTSGIQATTVRVTASLSSNAAIFAQSTAVSILGAPPSFVHFSIAPALRNVAGRVSLGIQDKVSAFVNDRFGNAVPAGTAVTFETNAASVVSPTTTDASGVATATLLTEAIVPPTGIVTVLAYTHGEESFLDNNGNGIFDAGDTILTDDLPEPFIEFRPLPPGDAGCLLPPPFCNGTFVPGTQFERFVDANGNGIWDKQGQTNVWDSNILVFDTTTVTFSGPLVAPTIATCSPMPCDGFNIPNGGSISFTFNVHDDLLNPLVGGSTISVTASAGTVSGGSIAVPDGESFNRLISGLTQFTVVIADPDPKPGSVVTPSTITLTVTSPNGNGTFIMASGVFN